MTKIFYSSVPEGTYITFFARTDFPLLDWQQTLVASCVQSVTFGELSWSLSRLSLLRNGHCEHVWSTASTSQNRMPPAIAASGSSAGSLEQFYTSQWQMTALFDHLFLLSGRQLFTLIPRRHLRKHASQFFRRFCENIFSSKAYFSTLPVLEPNPENLLLFLLLVIYFVIPLLSI